MEKIVSVQVIKFLEDNSLLTKSQHGFRQMRSTMTAHSHMQQDWIENKEEGLKTGLLIWDLTAAFDILDINLLCQKLELYGFAPNTSFQKH